MDNANDSQNQGEFDDLYSKEFGKSYAKKPTNTTANRPLTGPPQSSGQVQGPTQAGQRSTPPSYQPSYAAGTSQKGGSRKLLCSCVLLIIAITVLAGVGYYVFFLNPSVNPLSNITGPQSPSASSSTSTDNQTGTDNLSSDQLKQLGCVTMPEGSEVVETYEEIDLIASSERTLSENEVKQLKYHIDNMPLSLRDPGPKAIVSVSVEELDLSVVIPDASITIASCDNIFVTESSFMDSVDTLHQSLVREFVFVKEFHGISTETLSALVQNGNQIDLSIHSDIVTAWAENVGWEAVKNDQDVLTGWNISDTDNISVYAAIDPSKDMAESISSYVADDLASFSDDRNTQVMEFFPEDEKVKQGILPVYAGSIGIEPDGYYDVDVYDSYENNYTTVNLSVFRFPEQKSSTEVIMFYRTALEKRGFEITSWQKSTGKNKVITFTGSASYGSREITIMITSYDNATGFAVKPTGTYIAIVSGYEF